MLLELWLAGHWVKASWIRRTEITGKNISPSGTNWKAREKKNWRKNIKSWKVKYRESEELMDCPSGWGTHFFFSIAFPMSLSFCLSGLVRVSSFFFSVVVVCHALVIFVSCTGIFCISCSGNFILFLLFSVNFPYRLHNFAEIIGWGSSVNLIKLFAHQLCVPVISSSFVVFKMGSWFFSFLRWWLLFREIVNSVVLLSSVVRVVVL